MGQSNVEVGDSVSQSSCVGDLVVLSIEGESAEVGEISPVLDDVLDGNGGQIVHAKFQLEVNQISQSTDCVAQSSSEAITQLIAVHVHVQVSKRSQGSNSLKDFLRSSHSHLRGIENNSQMSEVGKEGEVSTDLRGIGIGKVALREVQDEFSVGLDH